MEKLLEDFLIQYGKVFAYAGDIYPEYIRTETPLNIAEDMINLLPDSVWTPYTKFAEVCCKTGVFIRALANALLKRVDYSFLGTSEKTDILEYIYSNQLYALCLGHTTERTNDDTAKRITSNNQLLIRALVGSSPYYFWENLHDLYEINDKKEDDLYSIKKITEQDGILLKYWKELFGDMKIDVVVGNPPYNNDAYLPFVEFGHQLAQECSLFITPAKWQANSGEKNEAFRQNIVPHMSKIVYYQCEGEVFGINMASGIAYYLIDKDTHDDIRLLNKSDYFDSFRNDWVNINNKCSIYNIKAMNIINKIGNVPKLYFDFNSTKKYKLNVRKSVYDLGGSSDKNGRGIFYYGEHFDKGWVNNTIKIENEDKDLSSTNIYLTSFDTVEEANNFVSYLNTRFVRYLNAVSVFGYGNMYNEDTWRFVPDPGAFDHIFTDEELYKKYNLTEEEINIIESVIKERT